MWDVKTLSKNQVTSENYSFTLTMWDVKFIIHLYNIIFKVIVLP